MAAEICIEALRWRGTPFVDQGCLKGVGVDCANYVLGVAQALGLVPASYRPPPYHPAWHLHHEGELLWQTMASLGVTPKDPGAVVAGDLVLFKFTANKSHGHCAIIMPEGRLIHATLRQGVVLHRFSPAWQRYGTLAGQFPRPEGLCTS